MADKKVLARQVYGKLIAALDERKWHYRRDDDKMLLQFDVNGDDLPMDMRILVDEERQLIRVLSPMGFKMSEEKRLEGAVATCVASFGLADGSFDYDINDGTIGFRLTYAFHDSNISGELLQYMISWSLAIIDKYNDKFMAIDKGYLSLKDFIASDN